MLERERNLRGNASALAGRKIRTRAVVAGICIVMIVMSVPAGGMARKRVPMPAVVESAEETLYRTLYLEAVCQREKGNYSAEYELLQRALRVKPDADEAWFDLARCAEHGSVMTDSAVAATYEHAIALLDGGRKDSVLTAQQAAYRETFAQFLMNTGRYAQALPLLKALTTVPAKRETAFRMMVAAYARTGQADKELQTLTDWERAEGDDEQIAMMKVSTLKRLNRYDEAIRLADSLARQDPRNDYFAVNAAEGRLLKGDTAAAMAQYKELKQRFPESAAVDLLLVHYYQTTKDHERLIDAIEKTVLNNETDMELRVSMMQSLMSTLKGTSRESHITDLFNQLMAEPLETDDLPEMYAQYLASKNSPDSAYVPAMERMVSIDPKNKNARLVLVQEALNRRDYATAVRRCEEGRQYLPDELTFYHIEGGALFQEKHTAEALKVFEAGMAVVAKCKNKETVSNFLSSYADVLHDEGEKTRAYALYDSALVYTPGNVVCLNNYAYFLSVDGARLDDAARMSRQVLKIEPDNPTYIDTYAWILFRQKKYDEARTYMDKALEKQGKDHPESSLFEHAGDIYWHLGLKDQAVAFWREAVKAGGDGTTLKQKVRTKKYVTDENL